jgi:phytoene dehydrogenase-like protein
MPGPELDALVIGANLRGLVSAYVLASLGQRVAVVERGRARGGADGSFVTAGGSRFDHGLHLLDFERSPLTTRLFMHLTRGRVHRFTLRRAIALRGAIMPYAPLPSQMPDELARMLPGAELVDDLGDEPPTRERLARCYGRAFTDLVFDEVLPSFPSESRHRELGVDEARLMTNVYPWFFPRAARRVGVGDASRRFHDRLRAGIPQEALYPVEGGFGGFAEACVQRLEELDAEVLTDASDLHVELAPGTHSVEWVRAGGRRLHATRVFWAAAWPPLCRLLDLPCQETATDRVLLGSLRLNRPAATDWHEILVGTLGIPINRITRPAALRASDEPLLQVEFAFPAAHGLPLEAGYWRERWTAGLRELGVVDAGHVIEELDFRSFPMHFNAFGAEGEPLRDADPALLRPDSNIRPVVPSMANLNLNSYVPQAVSYVTSVVAGT